MLDWVEERKLINQNKALQPKNKKKEKKQTEKGKYRKYRIPGAVLKLSRHHHCLPPLLKSGFGIPRSGSLLIFIGLSKQLLPPSIFK